MSVAELRKVLKAPDRPLEVPTASDWVTAEAALGHLPKDYRDFMEHYGTGTIDHFLWIYNPASSNEHLNLTHQAFAVLGALAETAAEFPALYPMTRFPAVGGLLPFGGTDNGDSLCWVTQGEPDRWTVAVIGPRSPKIYRFDGSLSEFLTALIVGSARCDRFPADFLESEALFTPKIW